MHLNMNPVAVLAVVWRWIRRKPYRPPLEPISRQWLKDNIYDQGKRNTRKQGE